MNDSVVYYPPNYDENKRRRPFYIEFRRRDRYINWTLFKCQFIFSEEEMSQLKKERETTSEPTFAETVFLISDSEGHPYQIGNGVVTTYKGEMNFNTQWFLKFMVDALNDKAEKIKAKYS